MKTKDIIYGICFCIVGLLLLLFAFAGSFSIVIFVIGAFFLLAGIGSFIPSKDSEKKDAADDGASYSFNVAGVSYRQKAIRDLCWENEYYSMSKKELIDLGMVDETIYKYDTDFGRVSLVPDPDNEHDADAIKVMRRDVLLGYVPKDYTGAVHRIIAGEHSATAKAYAGPYKVINEDYDYDSMKETYSVDSVNQHVGLRVTITYNKEV